MTTDRRAKILYLLVAIGIPVLAVGCANAVTTYNHFYAFGAFILDSGWFSALVYRNGIVLSNPILADGNATYWQLHVSLLFLLGSLFSYVVPLGRIDFYWLWEGLIHAPLGAAVGLLFTPAARPRSVIAMAGVGGAALVFAFNGQALACMGYSHYEIFLASGLCIMLAGLASGRPTVAWLGLAAAIATREDGGAQAGTFLAVVLACDLLGKPFPVARRKVFVMGVVAGVATVLMMTAQKTVFHGGSLFHHEYLGEPAYAHLRGALPSRAMAFVNRSQYVWAPFGVAVLVGAIDRDARWLLGSLATLPWFVLNFLANQQLKTTFDIYTGFPFIGSIFWLGAYGVVKHGPRVRSLTRLAVACVAATAGLFAHHERGFLLFQLEGMARPWPTNAAGIRAYSRALDGNANAYGRLLVDPAVGALGMKSLPVDALMSVGRDDLARHDAVSFYRQTFIGSVIFDPLVRGGFTSCGRLPDSELRYCTRPGTPLPPGFVPAALFTSLLRTFDGGGTQEENGERMFVEPSDTSKLGVFGPFMRLVPGHYRATVDLRASCPAAIHVEAFVFARALSLAKTDIVANRGPTAIELEIPSDMEPADTELRFFRAPCRYEIASLVVASE